uniref:Uncharacterized protein n=1 Tax=Oryza glumipatula TaxID=40148 RepID=A0A0D9Y8Q2_9ORYZ
MNENVFTFFRACEMMDGCATSGSSLYHTATSFHYSIVDYYSPPGYPLHYQSEDTDLIILLHGGYEIMAISRGRWYGVIRCGDIHMWEAGSK